MLTKRQALEDCLKLWKALADRAEDPNTPEVKYILAEEMFGYKPIYACPACTYAAEEEEEEDDPQCELCPIDKWRNGDRCHDAEYTDWVRAETTEERRSVANRIVKLVEESLANKTKPY